MKTLLLSLLAGIALVSVVCESVHEGVCDTTRPIGSVSRLSNSAMEGAAEGVAGQPAANPYGR